MTTYTSAWVARDGSNNGTKPKGARLALGGLVESDGTALGVKLGVLADSRAAVVSGAANMSYNLRAAVFVSNPTGSAANGAVIGANDATLNVATTAAPGSNSRIDVIWVRQHVVAADGGADTDVLLELGVTQGVAGAVPAVPIDGGGANQVPTGALRLYNVTVPTGTTATNTCTFTRVHEWVGARRSDAGGAFTDVTFNASWTNFGGSYEEVSYRLDGDRVFLRGAAKHATPSTTGTMFTLPSGYRPTKKRDFNVGASGCVGKVSVNTNGTVTFDGGAYGETTGATFVGLDQVFFDIAT